MAVEKRKLKSGKIRYRAYWRNPYTGERETGSWTTKGKAEKQSDTVLLRLKHDRESFLPEHNPDDGAPLTLRDLLADYHANAEMTDSTYEATYYHLKAVTNFFVDDLVADLTPDRMIEFEEHLRAKGRKQNGINRKIGIITAALTWAKEKKKIDQRPFHFDDYKCRRGPDKKVPPLTPTEIQRVMAVASPHVKRACFINYLTGARTGPSELLSMTWDDFFFDEGFIRVHSAAKNDNIPWRDIPVDDEEAWDILASWRDEDEVQELNYVITWKGKPIKKFRKAWYRTLKAAGIKRKAPPYSLRHAFVTELLKSGADLKTTSELAGHSDVSTTVRVYQHTTEEMKKQVAKKLPKLNMPGTVEQPEKAAEESGYTGEVHKSNEKDLFLCTLEDIVQ